MPEDERTLQERSIDLYGELDRLEADANILCAFVNGFTFGAMNSVVIGEIGGQVARSYTYMARELQQGLVDARHSASDLHNAIVAAAVLGTGDGEAGTHAH